MVCLICIDFALIYLYNLSWFEQSFGCSSAPHEWDAIWISAPKLELLPRKRKPLHDLARKSIMLSTLHTISRHRKPTIAVKDVITSIKTFTEVIVTSRWICRQQWPLPTFRALFDLSFNYVSRNFKKNLPSCRPKPKGGGYQVPGPRPQDRQDWHSQSPRY